jgi:hypothetical protein
VRNEKIAGKIADTVETTILDPTYFVIQSDGRHMNADVRSSAHQRTGRVLSWLVGCAVLSTLLFFLGMVRSDNGQRVPDAIAQALALVIVASEAVAFAVLLVGLFRWPRQIIRSPRWLLSGLAIVLVAAAVFVFVLITITAAIALP